MKKIILFILTLFIVFTSLSCKKDSINKEINVIEEENKEVVISPLASFDEEEISIAIKSKDEIKVGHSITLEGIVSNSKIDDTVTFEVVEGDATIVDNTLYCNEDAQSSLIKVCATSNENKSIKAYKIISVVKKDILTNDMLNDLNKTKVSFDGYLNIDLYTTGKFPKLYGTYINTVKTSMDGLNWYGEYDNPDTGTVMGLYYKNIDGIASQIGVSFMNEESYEPMKDKDGSIVSFTDSGLYNSLTNLTINDFTFDEETWRYRYNGNDATILKRVVASANPYDFVPNKMELIIEDDEILGLYITSEEDFTVVDNYKAIQKLIVSINTGDIVEVPSITKYQYDENHKELVDALENMRKLNKFKVTYKEIVGSYLAPGLTEAGYVEYVTSDYCYFEPFKVKYVNGEEVHEPLTDDVYGFKKINNNLYNAFVTNTKTKQLVASRAYNEDFKNTWPSFEFAAEIFTKYYIDEEANTKTYYVDSIMCPVASCFYYGLGNDANLYGIFATTGQISSSESFTPYVVVKDGYITDACFYFYLGSLYGVVELHYDSFDSEDVSIDRNLDFETRNVPTSWNELTINVSNDSGSTTDDEEVNALTFLKEFYDNENIEEEMPFFGKVLGDTYGFGLTTVKIPGGSDSAKRSIVFYYDVPLGVDYTINASLETIEQYLLELGFTKNRYGEFSKGSIVVLPTDSSLDLMIYVWSSK